MADGGVLVEWENIESRPFPVREYRDRLARVQESMARREISSLVVADPANLYYLTGYNAWSFYTPQCLIVPATGEPQLFMRAMDAQGAHYTAYLSTDLIHGYPEELVHRPDVHPFDWIAEKALEVGVLEDARGSRVAAETDAHFFSARSYLALRDRLQHAELVDSLELVNWVRIVKSPLEQDKMRVAGEIAQTVMQIALDNVEPGRRQCDVVAHIQYAQALGARKLGGDYPAIVPMLPTGETAGTPHLTWSDLPLRKGEATTIELAGVYHRYHVPLARTVSLGKPPKELRRCAGAVTEGLHAALDMLRPGSTGRQVQAAFADTIARYGYVKESRVGYSIGIGYPPDWGERTISLRAEDLTLIQPGMAFHVILGMWMDGWGYELSEPVLVGEDGPERLAPLPQELVVKKK
ncbi:M24 family metallopeptidase [Ornithinicoccus hortensis]|uniref:Ectoine hydrolase n=1 Tax=Ornithinicoccus hortensis TaxID=82346 RepID=A0A542YW91_9MICO|nr:M24 family metallopeptidase [Ornithinicoccus hortensis]TQL52341.1 ectoine hydrolase [Ornithinicoccus hortensis]